MKISIKTFIEMCVKIKPEAFKYGSVLVKKRLFT